MSPSHNSGRHVEYLSDIHFQVRSCVGLHFITHREKLPMFTHYVGSEIGRLRRVMLHRPNLSLQHLTPSNCQELLFDDVLSVERAGKEHDIFAETLRQQDVEVLLLTNLLAETLAINEAKEWLLTTQVSDFRLGPS